jgi:hypothetical protein
MKEIKCEHYDKEDKESYTYELDEDTELNLCEHCNMNLAGEIMKQLALEVFLPQVEE